MLRNVFAIVAMAFLSACASAFALTTKEHVDTVVMIDGGSCTGAFIGPSLIATADHCVKLVGDEVDLTTHDGRKLKGRVYKANPSQDVALVTVDNAGEFRYNLLRCDRPAEQGEAVTMIGAPNRLPWMFTKGYVAGVAEGYIILDIRGWFGSSGSAVLDADGRVIGIVSVAVNDPTRGALAIFLGAIPVKFVCELNG